MKRLSLRLLLILPIGLFEAYRIQIGDILVTKETRIRRDLDRDAIESVLGDVSKYEKETVYEVLDLNTFQKRRGVL